MIIPKVLGEQLATHATNSKLEKLAIYLKLRDFYEENEDEIKATGIMEFYKEAAIWMKGISAKTVQDNLGIIRQYHEVDLTTWLSKGLSFNHIATANRMQNIDGAKYDKAHLYLWDAIRLGNENGYVMTVEEMWLYGMGEKHPLGKMYNVNRTFDKWIAEIPTQQGWSPDKGKAFEAFLADTRQRMQDDFFNE